MTRHCPPERSSRLPVGAVRKGVNRKHWVVRESVHGRKHWSQLRVTDNGLFDQVLRTMEETSNLPIATHDERQNFRTKMFGLIELMMIKRSKFWNKRIEALYPIDEDPSASSAAIKKFHFYAAACITRLSKALRVEGFSPAECLPLAHIEYLGSCLFWDYGASRWINDETGADMGNVRAPSPDPAQGMLDSFAGPIHSLHRYYTRVCVALRDVSRRRINTMMKWGVDTMSITWREGILNEMKVQQMKVKLSRDEWLTMLKKVLSAPISHGDSLERILVGKYLGKYDIDEFRLAWRYLAHTNVHPNATMHDTDGDIRELRFMIFDLADVVWKQTPHRMRNQTRHIVTNELIFTPDRSKRVAVPTTWIGRFKSYVPWMQVSPGTAPVTPV